SAPAILPSASSSNACIANAGIGNESSVRMRRTRNMITSTEHGSAVAVGDTRQTDLRVVDNQAPFRTQQADHRTQVNTAHVEAIRWIDIEDFCARRIQPPAGVGGG